jgi:CRISPR-associated protein Cmr6
MKWWFSPRESAWKTPYPLPADTAEAVMADTGNCENFGLLLDRYVAYSAAKGSLQLVREFSDRRALGFDFEHQRGLLEACRQRWCEQAESLGAVTFTARPQWRVIVGLSTNAVLETGITLDPVFGVPIIPGSCLKGVARCFAQRIAGAPADHVDVQFGWQAEEQSGCGDLVFLSAVPVTPPQIERDVVSPIFGEYYRGEEPPASYLNPNPFFFLTVGKASYFQFGVASLDGDRDAAEEGARWLQEALTTIGVGAKTGAGYGFWVIESADEVRRD